MHSSMSNCPTADDPSICDYLDQRLRGMNFEEHGEVSWVMKEDLFSGTYVYTYVYTYVHTVRMYIQ